MLGIREAKKSFFDRAAVTSVMDRKTARALARFGGLVRKTAKGLIRTRKGASKPGMPPSSHTGLLRKWIMFFFDASKQSVIIGPTKLQSQRRTKAGNPTSGKTIPQVLEEGGDVLVADGKKFRRATVQPRPFMGPALAKKSGDIPRLFAAD